RTRSCSTRARCTRARSASSSRPAHASHADERAPMSARRRVLVPLVLVLAALAAAELGARVLVARLAWRPLPPFGHGAPQREWLERVERELVAGKPPSGYTRFDAELGWTTRPGYASSDGSIHVNAQGVRATHEHPEPGAAGARRVIACGESFTFSEEVADA